MHWSSVFSTALLLCAQVHGFALTPSPHVRCVTTRAASPGMIIDEALYNELCILLPSEPFPGAAPALVGGEMDLAELEDSCESRTQIFLHQDGTVSCGQTNGPPPVATCGLWQCGSEGFQMVIQRTFTTERFSTYTVTRVYRGQVNPSSTGVKVVDGQMGFHGAAVQEELPPSISGADGLFDQDDGLGGASAIGFFSVDGNTLAELEPADA